MKGVKDPPRYSPFVHRRERDETLLTFDEYLELEQVSPVRHEFVRGRRFAMSGMAEAHDVIATNALTLLTARLRGGPCRAYSSDMKVRIRSLDVAYYPDTHVQCGEKTAPKATFHEKPVTIFEVLSPSTSRFDRGEKFEDYRRLRSLRSYVLVSSGRRRVEVRRLSAKGELATVTLHDGDELTFPELVISIFVAELYEDSGIEPDPVRAPS